MVAILNHSASDVYSTERDVSQVIRAIATTTGAIVGESRRGPLGLRMVNEPNDLLIYGPSDVNVGFLQLCARDALQNMTQLWVNRVVGDGFAYAGCLLQDFGTFGSRALRLEPFGMTGFVNPADGLDFATAGGVSDQNENLAYIYAIGPGLYYNNYAIDIQSDNLNVPTNVGLTKYSTGGTLTAATYAYRVVAVGTNGHTLASTQVTTTVSSGSTNLIVVSWDPVPGASGYRIYGRVSGSIGLLGTMSSNNLSFNDTGVRTPGVVVPSGPPRVTNSFTVRIFDLTKSAVTPQEVYPGVTRTETQDPFGNQTELSAVINARSTMVRVVSNYANLTQTPNDMKNLTQATFIGGANGSIATVSDLVAGWAVFDDPDSISVNVLINAGYSDATIQNAMVALCEARKDCIALLDVPALQQAPQDAISYRNETGFNSSRAMLLTPDYLRIDTDTGKLEYVPPSGAVASFIALTDYVANAGTSPAGLNRGKLTQALQLRYKYNAGQRDQLASAQISYFRSKLGAGTYLNEQLTTQQLFSALSFISVRRIFDIMEGAIALALEYVLQENNTDFTLSQIVQMLTLYLDSLKVSQTILDYSIAIDRSPATRGQGIFGIDVSIEPTLPINQISLLTFITRQGQISFQENTN